MIFRVKESFLIRFYFLLMTSGIFYSMSGYVFLGTSVYLGKISNNSPLKRGISSATNLERFISLNDLIKSISSSDLVSNRLVLPAVLNTDNMFLRPKS